MIERKKPSARFAIVFMLILAAIAFGVYLTFSTFQRSMANERRESSARNLAAIGRALNDFAAKNNGRFPERAGLLTRAELPDESVLIHAAWPDQPGYVYIPGVRANDDSGRTILAYENVPERKRKLGIQVLWLSGKIELESVSDFTRLLGEQEASWKKEGRIWMPETMGGT